MLACSGCWCRATRSASTRWRRWRRTPASACRAAAAGARSRRAAQVWIGDSLGEMPLYYATGGRRPARWQLRAARRPEPDRGGRLRLPGGDGAAHLQLRRGGAAGAGGRRIDSQKMGALSHRRSLSTFLGSEESRSGGAAAALAFATSHRGAAARSGRAHRRGLAWAPRRASPDPPLWGPRRSPPLFSGRRGAKLGRGRRCQGAILPADLASNRSIARMSLGVRRPAAWRSRSVLSS